jgi:protein involved in temperature-dependent protein secretion
LYLPPSQLKKQLAELLAAKEEVRAVLVRLLVLDSSSDHAFNHLLQMTTTQAEASERFAKERAELEARVMEQERLLEEERRQAAKSAEQERRIAEALAMAEEARNTAMETAAKVVAFSQALPAHDDACRIEVYPPWLH